MKLTRKRTAGSDKKLINLVKKSGLGFVLRILGGQILRGEHDALAGIGDLAIPLSAKLNDIYIGASIATPPTGAPLFLQSLCRQKLSRARRQIQPLENSLWQHKYPWRNREINRVLVFTPVTFSAQS